ncbi:MAG: hypothetical protein R2815_09765 [Flavobacteriales bacterium]|nr:hypothetical protein [Flavobacteriales bacterium]
MGRLGLADRFRWWMHRRICNGCITYTRQAEVIDRLLAARTAEMVDTSALQLRILERIRTGD